MQLSQYRNLSRLWDNTCAVIRTADHASAARWLAHLIARSPEVARTRSLSVVDRAWRHGARFRTHGGRTVLLSGELCAGAREMYCRKVYLRSGLRIPAGGWVFDLGANAGLFSVLAAIEGASVVAVEAQRGFAAEVARLAALNGVAERLHIEVALATAAASDVALVGVLADNERWRRASHAAAARPPAVSVPELMARYHVERVGLLKIDIEDSEFSVLHADSDLGWLSRVDQIAMGVDPEFGDVALITDLLVGCRFTVTVADNDGVPVPPSAPAATYLYACRTTSG